MDKLNISVVVPLYNEAESLPELAAWIDRVMRENGFSYELILIDDGSSDGSWEEVERLKDAVSGHSGHRFRAQLRQVRGPLLRIRGCGRRGRHYDGRRLAGFARRNPRAAPHDPRRGLRPGLGVEKETPRPDRQTLAQQILQLDGPGRVGHPAPRFQLRAESLPPQGGEGHRGLRRDAPLHSVPGQAGRVRPHRREGRRPSRPQVRQFEIRPRTHGERAIWT